MRTPTIPPPTKPRGGLSSAPPRSFRYSLATPTTRIPIRVRHLAASPHRGRARSGISRDRLNSQTCARIHVSTLARYESLRFPNLRLLLWFLAARLLWDGGARRAQRPEAAGARAAHVDVTFEHQR